jgi:TatD DNase family protein
VKRDIHHTLEENTPVGIELVDTHCHIHFPDYELDTETVIQDAAAAGVTRLVVVGCTVPDSRMAVEFAALHENVWASIGLHPHEGARYVEDHEALQQFRELAGKPKVVAIGEIGLDYYYEHSPKEDQIKLLKFQLDLAVEHDLPAIFHVRDAFDDFWPIFDSYEGLRGVIHSFTSDTHDLEQILSRGLYVGLNGIMTFTNKQPQLEAARKVPTDRLVLETDAPFLTPAPFRGKVCESKHVRVTGEFLADLRGESFEDLAGYTTANARKLFNI